MCLTQLWVAQKHEKITDILLISDLFKTQSFLSWSWMLYLLKTKLTDIDISSQNYLITIYLFFCFLYSILHLLYLLITDLLCFWPCVVKFTYSPKISPYFTILRIIVHHQLSFTPTILHFFYPLEPSIKPPHNKIIGMWKRLLPNHIGLTDSILRMWMLNFEFRYKNWLLFFCYLFISAYHFKNDFIIESLNIYNKKYFWNVIK